MNDPTDWDLLRKFIRDRSDAAFAELVRRHVNMVYSAARRDLGGDEALADDVTQAVFIILAKKAATLKEGVVLAGWLFHTVRYAAAAARRAERRRTIHEHRAAAAAASSSDPGGQTTDDSWDQVAPLLDTAINTLPHKDRDAVVLRYLEGKSLADIGSAMGVSEGAAKVRVSRAIAKLRSYFARRGRVTLSADGLDVMLLTHALATAPTATVQLASAAGSAGSAGAIALTSTSAAVSIASGAMQMIRLSALKVPIIATVAAASVIIGSFVIAQVVPAIAAKPGGVVPATAPISAGAQAAAGTVSSPSKPNLHLTLGWNNGRYDVPLPATLPDAMRQSKEFREWERVGDMRTLAWVASDGTRYVADCWAMNLDPETKKPVPMIPHVSRFRPDGTLEITTNNSTNLRPQEWTLFAADGKTKVLSVTNRLDGLPGTPFIQYVSFLNPDGTVARKYQANSLGMVYLEWFYKPNGDIDHWNGTGKLDKSPR